jgi:hypothetical protein
MTAHILGISGFHHQHVTLTAKSESLRGWPKDGLISSQLSKFLAER